MPDERQFKDMPFRKLLGLLTETVSHAGEYDWNIPSEVRTCLDTIADIADELEMRCAPSEVITNQWPTP